MTGGEREDIAHAAGDEAFAAQLARYGRLVFSPVGGSMFPMLRGGCDVVVMTKPEGAPRRLDVVLYRNDCDAYVLHRVLRVTEQALLCMGDGRLTPDPPVPPERVLAVMRGFYRGARWIDAKHPLYRAYARLWCAHIGLRRVLLRVCYRARTYKRRWLGEKKRAKKG